MVGSYLLTTVAVGAGLDYPSMKCIIHADAPDGMVNYRQKTDDCDR